MSSDDPWRNDPADDSEWDQPEREFGQSGSADRSDSPVEPAGMSKGTKVMLVLAGGAGLLCLICCGVGAYMVNQFQKKIENAVNDDPATARRVAREIVDWQIPEQFTPVGSMDVDFFSVKTKLATYESTKGEGVLLLMEIGSTAGDDAMNNEQMQQQLEQQMQQQDLGDEDLNIHSTEVREFEVNGQMVGFQFSVGENPDTGQKFHQVTGAFPSKGGSAYLLMQVSEDGWDEDAIVRMLDPDAAPAGSDPATGEEPAAETDTGEPAPETPADTETDTGTAGSPSEPAEAKPGN